METFTKSISSYIITSIPGFNKLNDHLFNATISGFLGFTAFLMIIFIMHVLLFVIGTEKLGMDFLDFLLAGFGFFLQMTGSLIKSFNK
jgi:hypothetical protein